MPAAIEIVRIRIGSPSSCPFEYPTAAGIRPCCRRPPAPPTYWIIARLPSLTPRRRHLFHLYLSYTPSSNQAPPSFPITPFHFQTVSPRTPTPSFISVSTASRALPAGGRSSPGAACLTSWPCTATDVTESRAQSTVCMGCGEGIRQR